ncbi:chromatin-remodeling complexes subunit ngg1 [Ceratobasidium sp. AG-Ba]|nr:chromatin-remodeling complexes subunit ngg1 [Ceratobasidium sp. AG-Ba]
MPLSPLPIPSIPTHFLFSSKTDSVPSLDELVQLEQELKSLRADAISRRDKAESASLAVTEFWRRAKEKVKEPTRERPAKSKDVDKIKYIKIKRETTGTPDVEDADMRYTSHPSSSGHASKGYTSSRSFTSAPTTYKKSKLGPTNKKRKHADSDGEVSDNAGGLHQHKSNKANGSSKSGGHGSHTQANPRVAEDFTLPSREIVPPQPNLAMLSIFPYLHQTPDEPPPPKADKLSLSRHNSALPSIASTSIQPEQREDVYAARTAMNSNPLSVEDDFSAARQPPNQTTIHTFWTAAEPWIKTLGIEDLANLELEGDDIQPYEFVPLGRHYLDRWDDEDTQAFAEELGAPSSTLPSLTTSTVASKLSADAQQAWDPASIAPADLVRDERSLGTVRARLLAAFLPVPGGVVIGKEDGGGEGDEREKERRTGTGSTGVMGVLDVPDLEDRLRAEASAIGLLGDEDSEPIIPADDEIASSLRRLQRILRAQSALNTHRKRILRERADEALALADYRTTLRTTLDKPITTAYTKILRSSASKPGKKNKNKSSSGTTAVAEENLSAGGIPLGLPQELMKRVHLRKRFVETIRSSFQDQVEDDSMGEKKQPRRHIAMVHFPTDVLLPERSIYEGVEEEVEKELGWPFRSVAAGVYEPPPADYSASGTNGIAR